MKKKKKTLVFSYFSAPQTENSPQTLWNYCIRAWASSSSSSSSWQPGLQSTGVTAPAQASSPSLSSNPGDCVSGLSVCRGNRQGVLYHTIQYDTIHYTLFYYTTQHYLLLDHTVYYNILYDDTLFYTILYCTALNCTVLCCVVP